jgi:hypothetical protein
MYSQNQRSQEERKTRFYLPAMNDSNVVRGTPSVIFGMRTRKLFQKKLIEALIRKQARPATWNAGTVRFAKS